MAGVNDSDAAVVGQGVEEPVELDTRQAEDDVDPPALQALDDELSTSAHGLSLIRLGAGCSTAQKSDVYSVSSTSGFSESSTTA